MPNDIVFRGTRSGLVIILPGALPITDALDQLRGKLRDTGQFFQGAEVTVQVGEPIGPDAEAALAALLARHQLVLKAVQVGGTAPPAPATPATPAPVPVARGGDVTRTVARTRPAGDATRRPRIAGSVEGGTRPLVISRTLRSGQAIRHDGDVIILGDVNPGSEVIAGGHIVVLGALRGVAHAGAYGDEDSIVTATRLQPTQLRIGTHVSRPPDDDEAAAGPELARIHEGRIVIESRGAHKDGPPSL